MPESLSLKDELLSGLEESELSLDPGRLSHIFEERPVDLTTFVQHPFFLDSPPLSEVQYEAVRYCEQVYYPELYELMVEEYGEYWKPVRMVNFATMQWGKGSGKDHICRIVSLRVAYLLLCLRSPQAYYGMPKQDSIHLLNVASSAKQAQRAFFNPMRKVVKQGWFAGKAAPTMDSIVWNKNVESISGHSDAESQEGLNLLVGVADEVDAFATEEEANMVRGGRAREASTTSDYILRMMRTSASTRFPEVYKILQISYPRYKGSQIQQLTRRGRRDNEERGSKSRHYVSGPLPTWKVNPRVKSKEQFKEDYAEDERMARAKYECKPDFSADPFFRNFEAWELCEREEDSPIEVDYIWNSKLSTWDVDFIIDGELRPIMGAQYAIHGDIAIRGDRAGVAMSHVKSWEEFTLEGYDHEEGLVEFTRELPTVVNDFTMSFSADLTAKPQAREIQIRWYRELIWHLNNLGFYIGLVSFDGYQSEDTIQTLELHGIETSKVSMDRNDIPWKTLRDMIYSSRCSPIQLII